MTRKLILFLISISIVFWVFKPNPPIKKPIGGVIKMTKTGRVHEFNHTPGIKEVSISLDNKRINKVNQRRDANLIHTFPAYFGKNSHFKPLITLKAKGPINVEIAGNGPTGKILFHIPEDSEIYEVEIYPHYKLERLFQGNAGDTETIRVSQWKTRGPMLRVDTINSQWSGPLDLFLSTKNLMDIASLIKEFSKDPTEMNVKALTINEFLLKLGEEIKKEEIRYETDLPYKNGDDRGWQLIRNPSRILGDKKANCIDIAILTSIEALRNGYKPYIWANSGHALCALSTNNQNAEGATPFEGTDYLKPPLKPPTAPGEMPREYLPNEEVIYPERQPPRGQEPKEEEIFSMEYSFWEKFYRENTQVTE